MNEFTISDEEWSQRRLCSDESCIGVIGPDGRCKECGKPCAPGDAPAAPPPDKAPAAQNVTDSEEESAAPPAETAEQRNADPDDDWANRRLCPDGNCIGVIGPDGRCKECGKTE